MNPLTVRELEVYQYLLQDIPMKEIAYKLHITPGTIDIHARRIYEKFGVDSRIGLILNYYTRQLEGLKALIESDKSDEGHLTETATLKGLTTAA